RGGARGDTRREAADAADVDRDSRGRARAAAAGRRVRQRREDHDRNPHAEADDELWPRSEPSMSETADAYTQRILAQVEGLDPLEVLATTGDSLARLIDGVPGPLLRHRASDRRWSINAIVAHLADGEIVIAYGLRLVLGERGSPVAAFDQDRWVEAGHYDRRDPRASVEQFRAVRSANLALLASLDAEQWAHWGLHSERGE